MILFYVFYFSAHTFSVHAYHYSFICMMFWQDEYVQILKKITWRLFSCCNIDLTFNTSFSFSFLFRVSFSVTSYCTILGRNPRQGNCQDICLINTLCVYSSCFLCKLNQNLTNLRKYTKASYFIEQDVQYLS